LVLDLVTYVWTRLHEDVKVYDRSLEGRIRKSKTCRVEGELPEGRVGHRLVAVGEKLYLIGGGVWSEKSGWSVQYYEMYVFDTVLKRWYLPKSEASRPNNNKDNNNTNTNNSSAPHPPAVCYPFSFVYGDMLFTTTLAERKVWGFDTVAEIWYEVPICGENEDADVPVVAHSMGAVGVVGNQAFFLGSYHIGPGSSMNDFYRLRFNF